MRKSILLRSMAATILPDRWVGKTAPSVLAVAAHDAMQAAIQMARITHVRAGVDSAGTVAAVASIVVVPRMRETTSERHTDCPEDFKRG